MIFSSGLVNSLIEQNVSIFILKFDLAQSCSILLYLALVLYLKIIIDVSKVS